MSRGKRVKKKTPTLHSYFLSLLSLVLCCAMFMSATMAWFTSDVKTGDNQILVGTLSVQLQNAGGDSLSNAEEKLFQRILYQNGDEVGESNVWQTGAVSMETFNIVNTGTLAFDYNLYFMVSQATLNVESGDASVDDVTDHFTVWVRENTEEVNAVSDSEEEIPDFENDENWQQVKIGDELASLTEILKPVTIEATTAANPTPVLSGSIMQENEVNSYTVALVMVEDNTPVMVGDADEEGADLSIMGRELQLSVRLVANQQRSTTDSEQSPDTAAAGE